MPNPHVRLAAPSGAVPARHQPLIVTRHIAADPAGVALLLSGPEAVELWPGLHCQQRTDSAIPVVGTLVDLPVQAAVHATAPQRTPTSYITRFRWACPTLPALSGELTLEYGAAVTAAPTVPTTHATLKLTSTPSASVSSAELSGAEPAGAERLDRDALIEAGLELSQLLAAAQTFLANLAELAVVRRDAA